MTLWSKNWYTTTVRRRTVSPYERREVEVHLDARRERPGLSWSAAFSGSLAVSATRWSLPRVTHQKLSSSHLRFIVAPRDNSMFASLKNGKLSNFFHEYSTFSFGLTYSFSFVREVYLAYEKQDRSYLVPGIFFL